MNEDSMPSKRMVPEQEVAEVNDELTRIYGVVHELLPKLAAAKAEITALTEQRDEAIADRNKAIALAQLWQDANSEMEATIATLTKALQYYTVAPGSWKKLALQTLSELDAEAAAESSPFLPETPEAT